MFCKMFNKRNMSFSGLICKKFISLNRFNDQKRVLEFFGKNINDLFGEDNQFYVPESGFKNVRTLKNETSLLSALSIKKLIGLKMFNDEKRFLEPFEKKINDLFGGKKHFYICESGFENTSFHSTNQDFMFHVLNIKKSFILNTVLKRHLNNLCLSKPSGNIDLNPNRLLFRSYSYKTSNKNPQISNLTYEDQLDDEDDIPEENELSDLKQKIFRIKGMGHNVFIIQPKIKYGPNRNMLTTPKHQLEEAITLVKTLPGWEVKDAIVVTCKNPDTKMVFGSGTIQKLKDDIKKNPEITALFISLNMLTTLQHAELEEAFQLPIYDRFTIVLQIFSAHAHTKEAKLQTALAEIPYLRSRLTTMHRHGDDKYMSAIGGSGETYISIRKRILFEREVKIKAALEKLRYRRQLLRKNRFKKQIPIIAVVGYTNSGKTTFIKALTDDEKLEPKDQLFATLDVTAHAGRLPNSLKAIFMDTIGFISDIPTTLIQSFSATLEDIALADLIIHVRDVSHPDTVNQCRTVLATLCKMNLPEKLMETILEVGNKVDLIEDEDIPESHYCWYASALSGLGMAGLRQEIEHRLMLNSGQLSLTFKVPMGGEETRWLYKFAGVSSSRADPEDANYLLVDAVMTKANLAKFKNAFGDLLYS